MRSLEDLERAFESGLTVWEKGIVKKRASVMGHKIVREVKRETPVNTGNLRRRWFFRLEERSGEIVIVISNDADYAAAVNNGHRIVRAKKTAGVVKGRHMLEKGIETYQSRYLKTDVEDMLQDLRQAMK